LVLLTIPEIVWESFVALYCRWKGLRPSPVLADLEAAPNLGSA